jgi:hypothetical protein
MNPLQQLKCLPWISLFQVSILTVLLATILDLFLILFLIERLRFEIVAQSLQIIARPPLGSLILIVVSTGIGALAVYLLDRLFKQVIVNAGVLWGLVLCLVVVISVKSWLPIPQLFIGAQQGSLLGLVLGVFLKRWRFWRR